MQARRKRQSTPRLVGISIIHPCYADRLPAAIYDVKFYPYTEPGEDAVFAIVAGREVRTLKFRCSLPCAHTARFSSVDQRPM